MILDDIVRGDAVADQPTEALVRLEQTPREAPAERASAGRTEEIPAPETKALAVSSASVAGPSAGSGRGMIWALAALVVLIGGVVAAYAISGDSKGKQTPAAVPMPTTARSASPAVTATPSSTAIPAGFRPYTGSGYTAAIPSGWTNPSSWGNGSMHSGSPDGQSRIEFYPLGNSGSALDALKNQGAGDHQQYQVLWVKAVTSGPFADPSGAKAAEQEYTWQSYSGKMHVRERLLQVNGHACKLLLQTPESSWNSIYSTMLAPVLATFTVTG